MSTTSKRDEFGRFIKKQSDTSHLPELPNENPDIGKQGIQSDRGLHEIGSPLAAASDRPKAIPIRPSTKIIPDGVAGVWHAHKMQGVSPYSANIPVPGATYAMVIPTDEFTCRLVIRVDLRDASGMSTSMTSVEMGSEDAMKLLMNNYTQTQFYVPAPTKKL